MLSKSFPSFIQLMHSLKKAFITHFPSICEDVEETEEDAALRALTLQWEKHTSARAV